MNQALLNDPPVEPRMDARRFERKRIPLSAKLVDFKGAVLGDCTIVDLSAVGAQVSLPTTQPVPERVFVVELSNRVAYEANVAWWRPGSAGLAFQRSYQLDNELPANREFLREILIETKLRQVQALTAGGRTLADAVQTAGLTVTMYAQWSGEHSGSDDLNQRLWELEAENAALRKMLAEMMRDRGPQPAQPLQALSA